MAQTGKTPKKQQSQVEQDIRSKISEARARRSSRPFQEEGMSQAQERRFKRQVSEMVRKERQAGRMTFAKIHEPLAVIRPKDLKYNPQYDAPPPESQTEQYIRRKSLLATGRPEIMTSALARGMSRRGHFPTTDRIPLTVNRPRGMTVPGMMTGPLLAALGDYIGRNTSVGQQLRSQMMKQQPSKKR